MPETETARQLRIKTGSVKRLHKELGMYSQELERETARVEKMKADGVDEYDVKQAVRQSSGARPPPPPPPPPPPEPPSDPPPFPSRSLYFSSLAPSSPRADTARASRSKSRPSRR